MAASVMMPSSLWPVVAVLLLLVSPFQLAAAGKGEPSALEPQFSSGLIRPSKAERPPPPLRIIWQFSFEAKDKVDETETIHGVCEKAGKAISKIPELTFFERKDRNGWLACRVGRTSPLTYLSKAKRPEDADGEPKADMITHVEVRGRARDTYRVLSISAKPYAVGLPNDLQSDWVPLRRVYPGQTAITFTLSSSTNRGLEPVICRAFWDVGKDVVIRIKSKPIPICKFRIPCIFCRGNLKLGDIKSVKIVPNERTDSATVRRYDTLSVEQVGQDARRPFHLPIGMPETPPVKFTPVDALSRFEFSIHPDVALCAYDGKLPKKLVITLSADSESQTWNCAPQPPGRLSPWKTASTLADFKKVTLENGKDTALRTLRTGVLIATHRTLGYAIINRIEGTMQGGGKTDFTFHTRKRKTKNQDWQFFILGEDGSIKAYCSAGNPKLPAVVILGVTNLGCGVELDYWEKGTGAVNKPSKLRHVEVRPFTESVLAKKVLSVGDAYRVEVFKGNSAKASFASQVQALMTSESAVP